jgi:hypothetical protein
MDCNIVISSREFTNLQNQITQLLNDKKVLSQALQNSYTHEEVENLKREYNAKLLKLENENKELLEQNKKLQEEVNNLKLQLFNTQSDLKNTELKLLILRTEFDQYKLKTKLMIGLMDINDICKLEQTENKELNEYMKEFRDERNKTCHYIRTKRNPDSEEMKKYKIYLIGNKLIEYKKTNDDEIEFVDELISYIGSILKLSKFNISFNLDLKLKEKAEKWWTS